MARMAGALGVRLEKRGAYVLGDGDWPGSRDIDRSLRLMLTAAAVALTTASIWSIALMR